jgi:hypothetical protein
MGVWTCSRSGGWYCSRGCSGIHIHRIHYALTYAESDFLGGLESILVEVQKVPLLHCLERCVSFGVFHDV